MGGALDAGAIVVYDIPASFPTAIGIRKTFSVHSTHPVTEEGTYTYLLVGKMEHGQDVVDKFEYAQMTGVFYPEPTAALRE